MTDQPENQNVNAEADDEGVVIGIEDEDDVDANALASASGPSGSVEDLKRAIFNVPIEVVVSVGTAQPLIGDLLEMGRNHLLPLNSAIDDPVELRVKGRVIARGELTQAPDADNQLGVKVTEIVNMAGLAE